MQERGGFPCSSWRAEREQGERGSRARSRARAGGGRYQTSFLPAVSGRCRLCQSRLCQSCVWDSMPASAKPIAERERERERDREINTWRVTLVV